MALNDISDGIANEAMEIAEASEVEICLVADAILVALSFDQFTYQLQEKWKYFCGEDFEILGTVPTENWAQVQSVAAHVGVQVTEIGNVILPGTESGNVFLEKGSQVRSLTKRDRKSTRLNSSHVAISYAVFCLKKNKRRWRDDKH